jgi:NTP pyrophosphatase (non-canonical NTP hydrolase)
MIAAFDFDGTLCSDEAFGAPDPRALELCRQRFDARDTVIIYTARPEDDRPKVEAWLTQHAVRYDALRCGKLRYDLLVDDRALSWPGLLTMVRQFNSLAEGPTELDAGIDLRLALIEEETTELIDAILQFKEDSSLRNRLHVLKEAMDVLYVVLGLPMLEGWSDEDFVKEFRHLHAANLERFATGLRKNSMGKAIRADDTRDYDANRA